MIILDTNVVSELIRLEPHHGVLQWAKNQNDDDLYLTTVNMAELLYGVELMNTGQRRDDLRTRYFKLFGEQFKSHILPFDEGSALEYAKLAADARKRGMNIATSDLQIAGIARHNAMSVATRDVRDFNHEGVAVINPWKA